MKRTENVRRHIGETLTIRWGTSRGRDTYGYTTCSLRNQRGQRIAACNGGGYDMRGTVVGHWLAATFPKELCALKPEDMPKNSHWEPALNPRRLCYDRACIAKRTEAGLEDDASWYFAPDVRKCPHCGGATDADNRDGRTVETERGFYGLRFYDPHYDPLSAKLEKADDLFTKPEDEGKTFKQLRDEGKVVDLGVIRAAYKQTSPHATERHTSPSIDGACGMSSVLTVLNAIGLTLRKVHDSSKLDVYVIEEHKPRN